ncbi:hypothetical protein FQR65_LT15299 [Abscondita terminalis]|nr:hypothetical protein FQR65_LT15299 [Abscondita terminalis]
MEAFKQARMFKTNAQGRSDSLAYNETDGVMHFVGKPIFWAGERQVTGDTVRAYSTPDMQRIDSVRVMGDAFAISNETHKREFRPLLPMINFIRFNEEKDLEQITEKTAGVIVETIQGAAGFIMPENDFFIKLKRRCEDVGALLILDEIQPGFGRTGKLFAFEHFGIVPDILVMGKGMGGGVPVGAFMASTEIMQTLSHSPKLGHITTFGGNPLIAAASHATLSEVLESGIMDEIHRKEQIFRELLVHPKIEKVNGMGLMLAVDLGTPNIACHNIQKDPANRAFLFGDGVWVSFYIRNNELILAEECYFYLMASMRKLRLNIPQSYTLEFFKQLFQEEVIDRGIKDAIVKFFAYRTGTIPSLTKNEVEYYFEAEGRYEDILASAKDYEMDLIKENLI